jgi:hypothetical protein
MGGDGGLQMTSGAIGDYVKCGSNAIWVCVNNDGCECLLSHSSSLVCVCRALSSTNSWQLCWLKDSFTCCSVLSLMLCLGKRVTLMWLTICALELLTASLLC